MQDWDAIFLIIIYFVCIAVLNVAFALQVQESINYGQLENITLNNGSLNSSQVFDEESKGISFFSALSITMFSPLGLIANLIFVALPLVIVSVLIYRLLRSGGG